jgi:hypothetical protein
VKLGLSSVATSLTTWARSWRRFWAASVSSRLMVSRNSLGRLLPRGVLANAQDFVLAVAQLLRLLLNQPLQLLVGALVGGDESLNLGFGEVQRTDVVEPSDVAEREQQLVYFREGGRACLLRDAHR